MDRVNEYVGIACRALDDKKAEDIRVIDISGISIMADYFIIATGKNSQQIRTLVDNVEQELAKAGLVDHKTEGTGSSSWVLLDYGDIIIHIFDEENRLFYSLERIWRDGKEITGQQF